MADKTRGVVGTAVHDEAGTDCGVVRVRGDVVVSMWGVRVDPRGGMPCAWGLCRRGKWDTTRGTKVFCEVASTNRGVRMVGRDTQSSRES